MRDRAGDGRHAAIRRHGFCVANARLVIAASLQRKLHRGRGLTLRTPGRLGALVAAGGGSYGLARPSHLLKCHLGQARPRLAREELSVVDAGDARSLGCACHVCLCRSAG